MKERTKDLLKDSFGSLVSNNRAISAAKTAPIWLTLIIFLLSVLLPVIPVTVFYANQKGSQFINANSFGLEKTIPWLTFNMQKENKGLVLNDMKEFTFENADSSTPDYIYVNKNTEQEELRVFFAGLKDIESQKAFIKEVAEYKVLLKEADEEAGTKATYYIPSFMVFFNNAFALQVYAPGTDVVMKGSSMSGDYKAFKPNENILEDFITVKDIEKNKPTTDNEIKALLADGSYCKGVFNNFKKFLDTTYTTAKNKGILFGTLIFAGVYLGMSLIMAFLIWVLTRGKNNPFNYMSFLTTFKIESWIALCPALIGLAFGFILGKDITIMMLCFIAPLGLRSMVLMTKQLRPME